MINKIAKNRIEKALEAGSFQVEFEKKGMTVSKFSPAGQDFSFSLDLHDCIDVLDVAFKTKEYYENYDPSSEAYLWLDEDGHGKSGAPYEMGDVYNDMKACEQYIDDAYTILINI